MTTLSPKALLTHGFLFALTFLTATLAGVQWTGYDPTELANFHQGLVYSCLLLVVLSSHELGHYIAARIHGVKSTLPYFLPFPPHFGLMPFGTLGAVIRIRSEIRTRQALFDIGVSGPISGFVVTLVVLAIGFVTLPTVDYLYGIHPEYRTLHSLPEGGLTFGSSFAYLSLAHIFTPTESFVPPMNEIYHYPFLCVGWFGLFITALNLIPVGQLDGGHITKAVFGRTARRVEVVSLIVLVVLGIAGLGPLFDLPLDLGWPGWLLWASVLLAMKRLPGSMSDFSKLSDDLDPWRRGLGACSFLILLTSFTPSPFTL